MYQTRLTSLSPPRGERGESLTFIGDFPASVGDVVWTDGHVIFGHFPRYDVPVLSTPAHGVPVWHGVSPKGLPAREGFYTPGGRWCSKSLGLSGDYRFLNNDRTLFEVASRFDGLSILDATVMDGVVYVAIRRGNNVEVVRDPAGDAKVVKVIEPRRWANFDHGEVHTLRFADGLNWTAWGYAGGESSTVVEESEWFTNMTTGGYTCTGVDYFEDHATAHYEFYAPTFTTMHAKVTESTLWSREYVETSTGAVRVVDGFDRFSRRGTRATGGVHTEPVTYGQFSDIGFVSSFWEGTCSCTSTFQFGGEWAWFGPEPLEDMNIVNHWSDSGEERVPTESTETDLAAYPYTYGLQQGFSVRRHKDGYNRVYDAVLSPDGDVVIPDERQSSSTAYGHVTSAYRGAYRFTDGSSIVLTSGYTLAESRPGETTGDPPVVTYRGDCVNRKFGLVRNMRTVKVQEL